MAKKGKKTPKTRDAGKRRHKPRGKTDELPKR
jgi:hypothetical protein